MTNNTYQDRDLVRVCVMKSDDAGVTWYADPAAGNDVSSAVILQPTTDARNVIQGTNDITPLTVKGVVGQSVPLFAAANSGGVTKAYLDVLGQFISNAHAAPANGAFASSDFGLWWTDTPSATQINFKGKDSGGTVVSGTLASTVQAFEVGDICVSARTSKTGWLLCDGAAVSRTTYAALFAIVGTTFGAGDGSTTFNVPNTKGRVPIGVGTGDAAGATAWSLGAKPTTGVGGEEAHTLTSGEMPSHTHTQNAHTHTVGTTSGDFGGLDGVAGYSYTSLAMAVGATYYGAVTAKSTTATNQNTGGGGGHNTMQPVLALNFFIKT